MLRRLLLAMLLLAVFPAVVRAQTSTQDFPDIMPMFPLPSGGHSDGMINTQLQVFFNPNGFNVNGQSFCYCYQYTVEMWENAPFPKDFLGGIIIQDCGNPFVAQPPVALQQNLHGNPAGWSVPIFTAGSQSIVFSTSDPINNGIIDTSTWHFVFYTNAAPVLGNITFTGIHCNDASMQNCFPVSLTVQYYVPCGPVCGISPCIPGTPGCPCIPCVTPGCPCPKPPPVIGSTCPHNFNVAQVYPALPLPLAGYQKGCITGTGTIPLESLTPPHHTTVPGVLCLATDPVTHQLNLNAFVDPACCASPVVQAVKLVKFIPGSQKCPDTYRQITYTQFGTVSDRRAIRTWWPLMYSMPGTSFTLTIQGVCTTGTTRTITDTWVWTVVANPQTFRYLIDWLHTSEINLLEIPCIVGEDTYQMLVACADQLLAATQALQTSPNNTSLRSAAFDAIFACEGVILTNALMSEFVDQTFPFDYHGTRPAADRYPKGPPPNMAQLAPIPFPTQSGFIGILDTFENPCACKMITDLESINNTLNL